MDNKYLKKVVKEEYEEGLTELQNKVKVYKRLGEELVGEERFYLKIIEHEIKDLEETDGDFKDYFVKKGYIVKERGDDRKNPGFIEYIVQNHEGTYPQTVIFSFNKDNDQFKISNQS